MLNDLFTEAPPATYLNLLKSIRPFNLFSEVRNLIGFRVQDVFLLLGMSTAYYGRAVPLALRRFVWSLDKDW